MPAGQQRYHAYLVRLWQVEGEDGLSWRASAENPHSGERLGFADVQHLVAFLEEMTAPAPEDWDARTATHGAAPDCPPK